MSNFMMFWRSTGLDQTIRSNTRKTRPVRNQRHVNCSQHSNAEMDAFERSLHKRTSSPWARGQRTLH